MAVSYTLAYHEDVLRHDIPRLSSEWRRRVKAAIERKLAANPEVFGKPLRTSLKGYRKLRVGNWRIIFRIESTAVRILVIAHREDAYDAALKRIT